MSCWTDNKVGKTLPVATRHSGGYTLLELVTVIILVMVLMTVAITRFLPLRGDAEASHIQTTLGGLRSALGLETTRRLLDSGPTAVIALENSNPILLLEERPASYIGEASANPDIEPGQWFFDPEKKALYYRVRYPQYLVREGERPVYLAWRIHITFDNSGEQLRHVRLSPWKRVSQMPHRPDPKP